MANVQDMAIDSILRPQPSWASQGPLEGVDLDKLDSKYASEIYDIPFVQQITAG